MANEAIGALWKKESQRGEFFSGNVEVNGEKIQIVVFPNTYKKADNHPDYRILLSQPREEKKEEERVYNEEIAF